MGRFPKSAAIVAVLSILLLLASGEARVVLSGDDDAPSSSSSAVKHVRKLLNTTAAMAEGVKTITSASDCSEDVVVVSQDHTVGRFLANHIPYYTVTITNTCLDCTVRDVHVACGEFASSELVSPSDFRRVAVGDCLVRNGGPLGPGDAVAFEYSNSLPYRLDVASVSCS